MTGRKPKLHRCNKAEIEQITGVKFRPRSSQHRLQPFECHSYGTVKLICRKHGQDHVCLVLKSIVSAPHNSDQLYKSIIMGVSAFFLEGNYQGQDLVIAQDVLRYVDLGRLRQQVREVNMKHISIRLADRLVAMTQGAA